MLSHSNSLFGSKSINLNSLCKRQALGLEISLMLPGCIKRPQITILWQGSALGSALLCTLPFGSFYESTSLMHIILQRANAQTNSATFASLQARAAFCHLKINTPRLLHACMSSAVAWAGWALLFCGVYIHWNETEAPAPFSLFIYWLIAPLKI